MVPTPGTANGFIPPGGGSISTGGDNPATLTLPPGGPGATVIMTQQFGAAFCNGPCTGPATFINNFPGYNDPNNPINLKLSFLQPNLVKALTDFAKSTVYKTQDNSNGVKVPDCKDDPAWTDAAEARRGDPPLPAHRHAERYRQPVAVRQQPQDRVGRRWQVARDVRGPVPLG